jgi:hypothetical protein
MIIVCERERDLAVQLHQWRRLLKRRAQLFDARNWRNPISLRLRLFGL